MWFTSRNYIMIIMKTFFVFFIKVQFKKIDLLVFFHQYSDAVGSASRQFLEKKRRRRTEKAAAS